VNKTVRKTDNKTERPSAKQWNRL